MVERSYYWDGDTTGDASLAKFNEFVYHGLWRKLFLEDRTVQGIICGYENECEVVGVSGGVTIDTGAALVDGQFYENTKKLTIDIPIPTSSTRIDVIVLRRNPTEQTIRATRIAGTEGAAAPGITQISPDGTWDLKIAEVSITTAGVITITDYRNCARSPILIKHAVWEEIETIRAVGGENILSFTDPLPTDYTHLVLVGVGAIENGSLPVFGNVGIFVAPVIFNGDDTVANYNWQGVGMSYPTGGPASASAAAATNLPPDIADLPNEPPAGYQGNGFMWIPYYNESFYKAIISKGSASNPNAPASPALANDAFLGTGLWENTSPITSVSITLSSYYGGGATGTFLTNSKFTLYGIK